MVHSSFEKYGVTRPSLVWFFGAQKMDEWSMSFGIQKLIDFHLGSPGRFWRSQKRVVRSVARAQHNIMGLENDQVIVDGQTETM